MIIKMKHYKISELLNDSTLSQFVTKKSIEENSLSSNHYYSITKNIRFKTSMLTSCLCDYDDASIVVKRTITVEGDDDDKKEIKS